MHKHTHTWWQRDILGDEEGEEVNAHTLTRKKTVSRKEREFTTEGTERVRGGGGRKKIRGANARTHAQVHITLYFPWEMCSVMSRRLVSA